MELFPFQVKALNDFLTNPNKHFCIAGVGAGKTALSLHWAKEQGKPNVLVVTPASKRDSHDFENEADAWFPEWRSSLSSFLVVSWQGLSKWLKANKNSVEDTAFIFDEVHSAKAGISSQRGTAFLKITKATDCWTGYTATPGDCWLDFYAYFTACNLVPNKTIFQSRFCNIQTFKGFPEIVGYREQNVLKEWWKEISLNVDISEMLAQLPPETHKVLHFKKPMGYDKVFKTRESLEGEFLDTTGGLCAYLRQMCVSADKLAYIADFIEGLGDRAILFYNFIKEGDILEETLKKVLPKDARVWRIDGKTHDIPTEQTCGKRDVILVQWQAGSMGLNLQFVNCWLSVTPNYSWTISTQARGRIKRIGQKRPMFFFYFMCDNTIEQSIYDCLKNKQDFAIESWLFENGLK